MTTNNPLVRYLNNKNIGTEIDTTIDASQLPAIGTVANGAEILVNNVLYKSNGKCWAASETYGSGLPFVVPSSGTINNTTGSITVTTAFDYIIGPSYSYFPIGALFAASPAGWYYTVWTAASIGTVYADVYYNGNAHIPTKPTTLTTVAGAYAQATGFDIVGPNFVVPGGMMGVNGCVEWWRSINNNNSANAKTYNTYFGGTLIQGINQTANPKEAGYGSMQNRGRLTAQISANTAHGDNGNASAIIKPTINTADNQLFSFAVQVANAADYAIIESHKIRVTRVE